MLPPAVWVPWLAGHRRMLGTHNDIHRPAVTLTATVQRLKCLRGSFLPSSSPPFSKAWLTAAGPLAAATCGGSAVLHAPLLGRVARGVQSRTTDLWVHMPAAPSPTKSQNVLFDLGVFLGADLPHSKPDLRTGSLEEKQGPVTTEPQCACGQAEVCLGLRQEKDERLAISTGELCDFVTYEMQGCSRLLS